MVADVIAGPRLTAPPCGDRRQAERFAEKCLLNPGRNGMIAGVSRTPLPMAFATATLPARTAWRSPATPRKESERSSMGSQKPSSTRRSRTSTCLRPSRVLRKTRSSRTVRSAPCGESEAEIAGEIRMLEVSFVERAGGKQNDTRVTAARGRKVDQVVAEGTKEGSEALDLEFAEEIGKGFGKNDAVFERVACAGVWVRSARTHHSPSGDRARSTPSKCR